MVVAFFFFFKVYVGFIGCAEMGLGVILCVSELKESLTRMGSDLKQGFISSLRTAWQTLNDFARAHTSNAQLQAQLAIVANQIEEEEKQQVHEGECGSLVSLCLSIFCTVRSTVLIWFVTEHKIPDNPELQKEDDESQVKIGMLNGGNRVDYVLQEKPIESFNEYLFALQSHLCYWYKQSHIKDLFVVAI